MELMIKTSCVRDTLCIWGSLAYVSGDEDSFFVHSSLRSVRFSKVTVT